MDNLIHIPCVILSGGKSSRMGEDKALMSFDGDISLIEYQYIKLNKIFKSVYISSKTNKFSFLDDDTYLLYDNNEIHSPMVALNSILSILKTDKIFVITVDLPLVTENTIRSLVLNSRDNDITIARDISNIHPLCGVFKNTAVLNITSRLIEENRHKIGNIKMYTTKCKEILFSASQFINVNTPEDFNQACYLLKDIGSYIGSKSTKVPK